MSAAPEKADTFEAVVTRYEEVLQGEPENSWIAHTIALIDDLMRVCDPRGLTEKGNSISSVEHWYTRVAAAITQCVVHPSVTLKPHQLDQICRRKQHIDYVFQASGYRSMRHLQTLMGKQTETGLSIPNEKVAVLLAFVGLEDLGSDLIDLAMQQPPEILLPLMIGWLNQRAVLTERAEQNRSKLLVSGRLIEKAAIDDQLIGPLVNAWMYCTYAESQHKHSIKASLNTLMSQLLARAGINSRPATRMKNTKPKVLVIHERFREQHAMFRCYAPSITSLKRYFEISAMAEEMHIDKASNDIFENFIKLGDGPKAIGTLVEAIGRLGPDIIYYPSLGMSHWTVMLAQLRLAPIQIMTHGHPATSMSPEIDYVYLNETDPKIADSVSERVLMGGGLGEFQPHLDLPSALPPLLRPSDREVRVAVNSKVMKLSYRLIDVCRRLAQASKVPVRFSFFPGERGLYFDGLAAAIRARLPQADVVPYVNYEQFLNELARCDLALAAFPFGNTNSTVDTSLLGLPTVAKYGTDSAGQTDALVLKKAGLADWLICKSDQEYYSTALDLIQNPKRRRQAMAGLSRREIRKRLFTNRPDFTNTCFADMFWQVYLHHDQIQASPQRLFHYKDGVFRQK